MLIEGVEWMPQRIVATGAGDIVVTTVPSGLAYLLLETGGVTLTLKNGDGTQVWSPLTGPDEDDHSQSPIFLSKGITLNFSGAGAASIKYK